MCKGTQPLSTVQGSGVANMLRPIQALCWRPALVANEAKNGVCTPKGDYVVRNSLARTRLRALVNVGSATMRRKAELLDMR